MGVPMPFGCVVLAGRPIRCMLFDLGSTLWQRVDDATLAALERRADARAAALVYPHISAGRRGLSADPDGEHAALGALIRRTVLREVRRRTAEAPLREPDFVEATRSALRWLGVTTGGVELGARVWECLRIRSEEGRRLFDDALSMLAGLQARRLGLGVVTNRGWGGAAFEDDLVRMGLRAYIPREATAVSADLGVRKPNPAIFEYALRGLGVGPEVAAMVGDSLVADVAGASALGMLTIWKPRREVLQEAQVAADAGDVEAHRTEIVGKERLLAAAWRREAGYAVGQGRPLPDVVIEHLSELLPLSDRNRL